MTRVSTLAVVLLAASSWGQGMLLPTDTGLKPLGIKYQRVSAEIVDGAAVTKVEQVFVNSAPRQLEAHYVFPLPKGAALQEFSLWINGVKTKGEVLEKKKAADIYEGIVRRLQDPGLLEYIDSDVFRARVFPVPANGEQKIELVFSQVLEFSAGVYQYHYPLGASTRGAQPLKVRQDFVFSANIKSKTPLRSIYSPTHKLGVSRKGEQQAVAGLELGAGADISKDLDLFYTVSDKAVGLNFLSFANDGEPGFFLALISPKTEVKAEDVLAKRVTFVVDTSGSMMGERIKLARESLTYCVQRLNPNDEFNVVRFSTDVEALFEKASPASSANVAKALDFVKKLEAIGGTAIDEAFVRGLKDGEGKGTRPHLMMFITDGHPTVGDTDEAVISAHAKKANLGTRVFTFGVGEDLNARLLDRLAEQGNGTSDFVRDDKEFELKVSSFFDKVANPVLADVSLDLSAFGAYDVYPKRLPDLFKGSQLVVVGRHRAAKEGTVVLSGSVNGKKTVFEYRADATGSAKYDFVPRLWAVRKVGYLLDEIRLHGERQELKDEATALGKKYGIVTPYTSYLVVEDKALQPSPELAQNRPGSGGMPRRLGEAPRPTSPMEPEALSDSFGGRGRAEAAPPMVLGSAEGKAGIAVGKTVRSMKDEEVVNKASEPARSVAGRVFISRGGAWVDSELANNAQTLKVKYLSDAYFALLKAKPTLKAAFALGSKVSVVVAKGKSVIIDPDVGEADVEKVTAFLK